MGAGLNTGYFGELTQDAVSKFQQSVGIPSTGELDQITRFALEQTQNSATGTTSSTSPTTPHCAKTQFNRTLLLGSVGDDVKALQSLMNCAGFTVATTGPGSKGQETTTYGPLTKSAVSTFQKFFADTILKPLGLQNPTGIFGPSTQKKSYELMQ